MTNEIIFEFETVITAQIPGNANGGIMKQVLQAINLKRVRPLTWEDDENSIGKEEWKQLQDIHASLHRTQQLRVVTQ